MPRKRKTELPIFRKKFDYLGCRFTSDGDDAADMRHRMTIAGERSRSLDYLWHDSRLPRSLKLRLYAASVCLTLTHGSEVWMLTPRALAMLNGFNSRQLHRITGRSYRDEATTPSYDHLKAVRARRQPLDGYAPPPTRTNHASRRPPRIGTRQPIPLLPTGKPLRGENSKHHHQEKEVNTAKLFKNLGSLFDANGGAEKFVNNGVNIARSRWRETTG